MLDWQIMKPAAYLPGYDPEQVGGWFPDWPYLEPLPHFNTAGCWLMSMMGLSA